MEKDFLQERLEKLERIRAAGINPYPYKYEVNAKAKEIIEKHKDIQVGEHVETVSYSLAGRLMTIREHGKTCFAHLKDASGQIQLYFNLGVLGQGKWDVFKMLDIGDFAGVKGDVFKTRTGEVTVRVKELELLSKAMLPLPEKFHGLTNIEIRYRQRYLDLISNPESMAVFYTRSCVIRQIRNFLDTKGFLEVETPMMHSIPGGAAAKPFKTFHNALQMPLYMRIAPELFLKRLIVGGFEKVYEINRNFRNEGMSIKHNPEFTMIELYQAYADYNDMMDLTEEMITTAVQSIYGTLKITYQDKEIDFTRPWKRLSMAEAVKVHAGLDADALDPAGLVKACTAIGIDASSFKSKGEIINEIFEQKAEAALIQPTFITDYPIEISPLSKEKRGDPSLVERFELFIYGREHANAFSELNDPAEQKKRFLKQIDSEKEADLKKLDEDYITALEHGMPPAGGLGIGIDRLVMLLTNSVSIRDVILFPQMRPETQEKREEQPGEKPV